MIPTHSYDYGGTFNVLLTVSDESGNEDFSLVVVNIAEVNDAPVADAGGPYSGSPGSSVTFDGSGSFDPDNQDGTIKHGVLVVRVFGRWARLHGYL